MPKKKPDETPALDHDERAIEYVNLKSLRADPRNPKAHAESAISASVDRFGFIEPIVVDSRTGFIASGHGRTSTLTRMRVEGQKPPKGVRVNGKGEWLVPVVYWRSDNDYESGAALIALNRAGELGGWVDESLMALLDELEDGDAAGEAVGFTDAEQRDLRRAVAAAAAAEQEYKTDVDDVPNKRGKARTSLGDVWILGDHRVICGDSTDPATYAALLGDERPDAVWTDPPYGVDYEGATKDKLRIQNDGLAGLPALLAGAFPAMRDAARPGAAVYVASAPGPLHFVSWQALIDAGFIMRQNLVWVKSTLVMGHSDYHYKHEPVFEAEVPGAAPLDDDEAGHMPIAYGFTPGGQGRLGRGGDRWHGDNRRTTVFEFPKPSASRQHPTMKPVDLIAAMLRNSVPTGGLVLDPFGGSGSTLVAADTLGMHARLIELDPIYVDVIVDRWEQLTGKKAHRAPMEG